MSVQKTAQESLAVIAEREADVQAWTYFDPRMVQESAAELDRLPAEQQGPLHGWPIAIKDIVDVAGMPCENGTVLDAGRQPVVDADCVASLKTTGALIMGKSVTTELAYFSPGKTRNPHDQNRTPGGSSSGSAAAVGAGMIRAAVGSQTNGSVVRPASFCGVVGYKPTRGLIPTVGAVRQSQSLDTIGSFARSVDDVAIFTQVMAKGSPSLVKTCRSEPPVTPKLAFVRTPVWDQADPATQKAFEALAQTHAAQPIELDEIFSSAHSAHRQINMAELAQNFAHYAARGLDRLSEQMQAAIVEGNGVSAPDYLNALELIEPLNQALASIFEAYDAILTPSAPGEAPIGLDRTGNPAFCTLWTLCGTPAITLPHLKGPSGMPVGIQLVAARGDDARLLRTARWLEKQLAA